MRDGRAIEPETHAVGLGRNQIFRAQECLDGVLGKVIVLRPEHDTDGLRQADVERFVQRALYPRRYLVCQKPDVVSLRQRAAGEAA
ncbi:hypothetical protein D3C72_1762980 [compost metagenome]